MTPEEPPDPVDGDTDSPVRALALKLIERGPDDLTDAEHLMRQTDRYWWWQTCMERWGMPPERVDRWLLCREYTHLQAATVITDAYRRLTETHRHYWKKE